MMRMFLIRTGHPKSLLFFLPSFSKSEQDGVTGQAIQKRSKEYEETSWIRDIELRILDSDELMMHQNLDTHNS